RGRGAATDRPRVDGMPRPGHRGLPGRAPRPAPADGRPGPRVTRGIGGTPPRPVHPRCATRCRGVVRPPAVEPDPPVDPGTPAARDRAGPAGDVHEVLAAVAAPPPRHPAARTTRAARGHHPAPGPGASRDRVGSAGAPRPPASVPPSGTRTPVTGG